MSGENDGTFNGLWLPDHKVPDRPTPDEAARVLGEMLEDAENHVRGSPFDSAVQKRWKHIVAALTVAREALAGWKRVEEQLRLALVDAANMEAERNDALATLARVRANVEDALHFCREPCTPLDRADARARLATVLSLLDAPKEGTSDDL